MQFLQRSAHFIQNPSVRIITSTSFSGSPKGRAFSASKRHKPHKPARLPSIGDPAVFPSPQLPRNLTRCMLDKDFTKWWLTRVEPFADVPPEKLSAEREAIERQQEYNRELPRSSSKNPSSPRSTPSSRHARPQPRHPPREHLGQPARPPRPHGLAVGRAGHHAEPRGCRHLRAPHHHRRRKARR